MNDSSNETNYLAPTSGNELVPKDKSTLKALGGVWSSKLHARRIESQERVVEAARGLYAAKLELAKIVAVVEDADTLNRVAETERDRVRAIHDEQHLRRLRAAEERANFELESAMRTAEKEFEMLVAQVRLKKLKEELSGQVSSPENSNDPNYGAELQRAQEELSGLNDEYTRRVNDENFDEVSERDLNQRINLAKEAVEVASAEVQKQQYSDE